MTSLLGTPYVRKAITCRICSHKLDPIFSLGDMPVNDFPSEPLTGMTCPITLMFCCKCLLVQQEYSVSPEILYKGNYWYTSGTTSTMRNQLANVAADAIYRYRDNQPEVGKDRYNLTENDIFLDIGSNDGTLLRSINTKVKRIGVEPAENLQEKGRMDVDILLQGMWGEEETLGRYWDHVGQPAKVVTAIGMFYDLDDPNTFIRHVAKVLADEGVFVSQFMGAAQMLRLKDVGNLAHEHIEFYTLQSLHTLFNRNGLRIFRIESNETNGGSYRIYACHVYSFREEEPSVKAYTLNEERTRIDEIDTYRVFHSHLVEQSQQVKRFVVTNRHEGVVIYGASTKGNLMLHWYDLEREISIAFDKSPEKHGRYMVGSCTRIYPHTQFNGYTGRYAIVFPYTFIGEFVVNERDWLITNTSRRFVTTVPTLTYKTLEA